MMDFTEKTVLITGATSGIGKACALAFASRGANLMLNSRHITEEDEVVLLCKEKGAKVFIYPGDVGNEADVKAMFALTAALLGTVDVLVNSAGALFDKTIGKMSLETFEKGINVNLTGTFLCCKEAFAQMKEKGGGNIINLSSLAGVKGSAGQANYTAAKAGVIALTKTLALEGARKNIRVNCIAPGLIETNMTASIPTASKEMILSRILMNRMGTPTEIANAVLFMASDMASYITGQTLHVNGGNYFN